MITSGGANGLVKRFVLRNPTMEVIAKAKAKEEVCVEYSRAWGAMKAVNWLDKWVVTFIPIANLFNKPSTNSCLVLRVDRAYYDEHVGAFPMDKNVESFTACNLSNWYEFEKQVGTFEVGQTEGKNVLGVSWGYGYEKTTYGELAEKLGVNIMTLHYHLSDKMEALDWGMSKK